MPVSNSRLDAFRRLLVHLGEICPLGVPIRLWDGSRVELGPDKGSGLCLAIDDPDAVTRCLRRPGLDQVLRELAAGMLAIEGGTLLDLAALRPEIKGRDIARRIDKRLLLRAGLPFLLGRGSQARDHGYAGRVAARNAAGRDNKALVQFHYDLSNEFYALFLDPEMQYSCGYFPDWEAELETAQRAKLDMICRKLRLAPGERFLDIGCGWGGLVCHAAAAYGVKAHGITLSEAQLAFASEKVARLGLADRVTLELKDYQALDGEFDKIASIGMFEHVGLDNHDAYFRTVRRLLRPRGLLLNHAITRRAKRSERAFRRATPERRAITRYIFPGGEVDYIGRSLRGLEANGFEVHDVEGWREHYALTTAEWCRRLYARRAEAERLVGPEKTRLWLLYLAAVSLAFDGGSILIYQTVASKRARGPSGLPPTRADLYA